MHKALINFARSPRGCRLGSAPPRLSRAHPMLAAVIRAGSSKAPYLKRATLARSYLRQWGVARGSGAWWQDMDKRAFHGNPMVFRLPKPFTSSVETTFHRKRKIFIKKNFAGKKNTLSFISMQ